MVHQCDRHVQVRPQRCCVSSSMQVEQVGDTNCCAWLCHSSIMGDC